MVTVFSSPNIIAVAGSLKESEHIVVLTLKSILIAINTRCNCSGMLLFLLVNSYVHSVGFVKNSLTSNCLLST